MGFFFVCLFICRVFLVGFFLKIFFLLDSMSVCIKIHVLKLHLCISKISSCNVRLTANHISPLGRVWVSSSFLF